jgi:hypothetical protein
MSGPAARAIMPLDPGPVGRDHREHGGCVDTVNWNVMPGPSSRGSYAAAASSASFLRA